MKKIAILILMLINSAFGQEGEIYIDSGNDFYKKNKFKEAESEYKKSIKKEENNFKANYNLGNSLYKQSKFEEATKIFEELTSSSPNKKLLANTYYNLGNSYYKTKKYKEAIEAYKNCLRLNPNDKNARHNLSLAKKNMPKNQEKKNQDKKDQEKKRSR